MSYESDSLRNTYLLFHYGTQAEILHGVGFDGSLIPDSAFEFPAATVDLFQQGESPVTRALDIGCAVGRSSFELSKIADHVIGIDFSHSFVDAADAIRKGESLPYLRYSEAHLSDELTASLPDGAVAENIAFEQGDAMNLRADLGSFDFVHAANLLCRLPEPLRFLNRLPDLVNPGGQLVMAAPCTWLEEYTPRQNQPAGATLDFLHQHLDANFELVEVREVPFLIREHVRKFQMSTSQTSLWRRKS